MNFFLISIVFKTNLILTNLSEIKLVKANNDHCLAGYELRLSWAFHIKTAFFDWTNDTLN